MSKDRIERRLNLPRRKGTPDLSAAGDPAAGDDATESSGSVCEETGRARNGGLKTGHKAVLGLMVKRMLRDTAQERKARQA